MNDKQHDNKLTQASKAKTSSKHYSLEENLLFLCENEHVSCKCD